MDEFVLFFQIILVQFILLFKLNKFSPKKAVTTCLFFCLYTSSMVVGDYTWGHNQYGSLLRLAATSGPLPRNTTLSNQLYCNTIIKRCFIYTLYCTIFWQCWETADFAAFGSAFPLVLADSGSDYPPFWWLRIQLQRRIRKNENLQLFKFCLHN